MPWRRSATCWRSDDGDLTTKYTKHTKGKRDEEAFVLEKELTTKYVEKKFIEKYSGAIAAFALVITTLVSNSTCTYFFYQDKMPETAKKLRKF